MAKLRVDKIAAPIVKDEFTGSVQFDGTGDYLSISKSGFTNISSTGAFAIECFVYFNDLDNYSTIFASSEDSFTTGGFKLEIYNSKLRVQGNSFEHADGSTTLSTGRWYHFAFNRTSNGNAYSFVDGVLVNSTTDGSATFEVTWPRDVGIGGKTDNTEYLNGYISNLRFCDGHTVYTSNFTVPTRELDIHLGAKGVVFPAADNRTVLLACQSSTDATAEATGRHILTANGNATAADANPGLFRRTLNLTTVTENTGSVFFDNSGDYLVPPVDDDELILGDTYSIEWWHYLSEIGTGNKRHGFIMAASAETTNTNESGGLAIYAENSGSDQIIRVRANNTGSDVSTPAGSVLAGVWQHCAVQVNKNSCEIYIDGVLRASGNTNGSVTQRIRRIGSVYFANTDYDTHGYISNLRICKGHVVYTSNFIPPTRELEAHTGSVDDRTVLLCCYDGENIFAEKTGRILRAVGDRLSSPTPTATDSPIGITTLSPGLTREVDPTAGPTFQGGAGFTSQNWLTLPKGTTTERDPKLSNAVSHGSARAIFGAIEVYPTAGNSIHYATIATFGNTVDFGDLVVAKRYAAGCASKTRGLFGGGSDTAPSPNNKQNSVSYITIATTGDSKDFGDLTTARWAPSAFSNATRGIWFSGNTTPANTNVIDYVTISTLGDALDFGDAFSSRRYPLGSTSDSTRGIDAGGHPASDNVIQYVTFASTGNAQDFGDLMQGIDGGCGGVSNGTRGVFAGGYTPTQVNTIQYITIQSMGNSKDFGDMTSTDARHGAAAESSIRGLFTHGGYPGRLNTIDAITIATTGNAVEFGDIIDIGGNDGGGDSGTQSGFSNGHGGLG